MTPAICKIDEGFTLTHRALTLIGSLVTIGVVFVGIGAAKGAATDQMKGKVDRSEYATDRAVTDGPITRDSLRIFVIEQSRSASRACSTPSRFASRSTSAITNRSTGATAGESRSVPVARSLRSDQTPGPLE